MKINPDYLNFLSAYIEKFDSFRENQIETLEKCVLERKSLEKSIKYYIRKYGENGREKLNRMTAALQNGCAESNSFYEQGKLEEIEALKERYRLITKRSGLENRYYFLSLYFQENKLAKEFRDIKKLKEGYNFFRDIIVKGNLKLVMDRAMKISHRLNGSTSLEFGDLFDAGLEGLINAVSTYDLGRKCMFSTHACSCIDGGIRKLVYGDDLIISHGIRNAVRRFQRGLNDYMDKHSHYPAMSEMSKKLNVSLKTAFGLWGMHNNPIVSLDYEMEDSNGESKSLNEIIPAREIEIEDFTLKPKLNKIFSALPERMRAVLALRIGIDDVCNEKCTLNEAAALVGAKDGSGKITRERIRQMEIAAIRKIRKPLGELLEVR